MHDTKCTVHSYLTYSALLTFRNCSYWTLSSTSATIYTSVSIDLIMICSLSDSSYWTFSFASAAAYALITNYMCHDRNLLLECRQAVSLSFYVYPYHNTNRMIIQERRKK